MLFFINKSEFNIWVYECGEMKAQKAQFFFSDLWIILEASYIISILIANIIKCASNLLLQHKVQKTKLNSTPNSHLNRINFIFLPSYSLS